MPLPSNEEMQVLKATTESIVADHVLPNAESVDRNFSWPSQSMQAFASSGLLGLHVPKKLGGHGQGLFALAQMTEIIAKACPSSAMCFGMHCVGTAVIAAKATKYHREQYLRKIAEGRHITTLALSESGSGSHLYHPETVLQAEGINYVVNGTKQFVTNGGHADSYVISTVSPSAFGETGVFSCLIVDRNIAGMEWLKPWQGFGMRGNASRGLLLRDVRLPKANLLGEEGDQNWFIFEIIAPYFLTAMSSTYLGIAQAAMEAALEHMKTRRYHSSGQKLSDYETLQSKIALMWLAVEKSRNLIHKAAQMGDTGEEGALQHLLASKIDAAETAVYLANEAMTLCGGMAYRENSRIAQLLRDARAGHVMAPTTEMLRVWLGRSLLGLPIL